MSRRTVQISFCAVWLAAAAAGFAFMQRYQSAAGPVGSTPAQWPQPAGLTLDQARLTLVMFAHPRCPCTRASLEELNRLMAQSNGRVATHIVILEPATEDAGWSDTNLRKTAEAIPNVVLHSDPNGELAKSFGAETSGFVTLFNPQGELLFKGGITKARGHAGDNAGVDAIVSFLGSASANLSQTPVYGCGLFNPETSQCGKVCVK